ncbi:proteasome core particle subunit beta 2 [Binucleata daphniae]
MAFVKTGTTIVGLHYANGIILASDTRATSGPIVADKNCYKVHYITDQISACGAGTAADTDRVTLLASKEMTLFERKYNRKARIDHCVRLVKNHLHAYDGHIGAALIIGGYDDHGKHLVAVTPHGYTAKLHFATLGSGSLAAEGFLEKGFKENMSREEAIALAIDAVKAGILNDLYSGSNVDLCIIDDSGKTEVIRKALEVARKENTEKLSTYPRESLNIIEEEVYTYDE